MIDGVQTELAAELKAKLPALKVSTCDHGARVKRVLSTGGLKELMENPNYWLWVLRQVK